MPNAAALRQFGGFIGEPQVAILEYDFANDGGSQGSFVLGAAEQALCIYSGFIHVVTQCTSSGSATVKVGTTDDDDGLMDTTSGAVANLTANAIHFETASAGLFMDTSDQILLVIGTEDLTAGKIHVHIVYSLLSS